jgi:hypothetical protein
LAGALTYHLIEIVSTNQEPGMALSLLIELRLDSIIIKHEVGGTKMFKNAAIFF